MVSKIFIAVLILCNIYTYSQAIAVAIPVQTDYTIEQSMLFKLQSTFGITKTTAKAIYHASCYYDFDPVFVATLLKTESEFKLTALSPKGYKGIGQTPTATKRVAPDVFHAVDILAEKFVIANNDTEMAVALYKGGNNQMAHKQAKDMLKLYEKIK